MTLVDTNQGLRVSILRQLSLIGVVLLFACGEAKDLKSVGDSCADFTDCGGRSKTACIVGWTGGYCTETLCTPGSCPDGARCVTGIQFSEVPFDEFCLATCANDGECRTGYRCTDISGPERVCTPLDS